MGDGPQWPACPSGKAEVQRSLILQSMLLRLRVFLRNVNIGLIFKFFGHLSSGNLIALRNGLYGFVSKNALEVVRLNKVENFQLDALTQAQPLVSVVIPCFNYGAFVGNAIESILRQTLQDIEIIVVDGGSTDKDTREILSKIKTPNTKVFLREGRHFVGSNRNFGIAQARGRYICCLDADDSIEPTYLEKAVFLLETYAYDIISTSIRFMGAKTGTIGILPSPDLQSMTQGNHVHTCAVFRRVLWAQSDGFFDVGLGRDHVAEDWDFWLKLSALGARIRNISNEPLFNYRIHQNGSLSSSPDVKPVNEQRKAILARHKKLLSAAAFKRSAFQRLRNLRCDPCSTALHHSMSSLRNKLPAAPTVLIVMPFMVVGGAERLLSELTAFMVSEGWRIVLVTTLPQHATDGNTADWFGRFAQEIYQLPQFIEEDEWDDFLVYLISSRNIDCIINTGSTYLYSKLPMLVKVFPKVALVDLLFNTVGHVHSHLRYKEYFSCVFAENTQVANWFLSQGWDLSRVIKLPSGINLELNYPHGRHGLVVSELDLVDDELVVGYAGRLSEEKGPDVFLSIVAACGHIKNVRFVMSGDGPMLSQIQHGIGLLPSDVRLNFLGTVADIKPYIQSYDILLLPSRNDGRPLAVLEALASGVVVIASNVGGLPELIEDEKNGFLCDIAQASQFVDRIRQLHSDRALLSKMKKNARVFAENNLDSRKLFSGYAKGIQYAVKTHRHNTEQSFH